MDITSITPLDEDSGLTLHLNDPTGKPEYFEEDGKKRPVEMCIVGSYSKTFRGVIKSSNAKRTDAARKGDVLTDADEEEINYETEAACIKWWCFSANGKPLPITGATWKQLAEMRPNWRTQFLEAFTDHERFFVASSAR